MYIIHESGFLSRSIPFILGEKKSARTRAKRESIKEKKLKRVNEYVPFSPIPSSLLISHFIIIYLTLLLLILHHPILAQ